MNEWKSAEHATYCIAFGLNDLGDGVPVATFKQNTLDLINEVKSIGARPVLITTKHYDFAGGHHSFDRNVGLQNYNARYRELASEEDVLLVDFYQDTKTMDDAYNGGDTSTRNLYGTNYQKWNTHLPAVPSPSSPSDWDNVHFNDYGSKVMSESVLDIIQPSTGTIITRIFTPHQNQVFNPETGITYI